MPDAFKYIGERKSFQIFTGKLTKKITEYMAAEKEYTETFTIGAVTPAYDLESESQEFIDISSVSTEIITKPL
ncbi:MAG: hypothetical protein ABIN97_12355 [Ginsengibacter sp.]